LKEKNMLGNLTRLASALTREGAMRKQNPFIERRSEPRLWCSELVQIWQKVEGRWKRIGSGVLEDISHSGACVQMEDPVAKGSTLRIRSEEWKVEGEVRYCVYRDIGYYVGLKLDEDSKWSEDLFRPQHLVDPAKVTPKKPKSGN
jgi:hypothetical protein